MKSVRGDGMKEKRMENETFVMGQTQTLTVLRTSEHGVYLGEKGKQDSEFGGVLLPKNQVPEGLKIGDALTVFVYRDSEDRPVATLKESAAKVGEFAYLRVKTVSPFGAFLDWGLEKDLFLPYREMEEPVKSGQSLMVRIYLDKSGWIASSTKLYEHLTEAEQPKTFRKEEPFEGVVYRINPEVGIFVAVCPKDRKPELGQGYDRLYFGLIPASTVFEKHRLGEAVRGRIVRVRADGKLDLSLRKRDFEELDSDGEKILKKMEAYGGTLPFSEGASPEIIKRELSMSKSAFKKALGRLYKEHKVLIGENEVTPYR